MKTILVAEDNPANSELLRDLLESRGYRVLEAADGEQALSILEETKPNLVLMDLQMPVLSGFEALKRIREDARFASLRVLALTAYAMSGDRERVLAAGFDGHVSKPIDLAALVKLIEHFAA